MSKHGVFYPATCHHPRIRTIKTAEQFRLMFLEVENSMELTVDVLDLRFDLYEFIDCNYSFHEELSAPDSVAGFIYERTSYIFIESLVQCGHVDRSEGRESCPRCFSWEYGRYKRAHEARKCHACGRCGNPIVRGDEYWAAGSMFAKTCWRCVLADAVACFGAQS